MAWLIADNGVRNPQRLKDGLEVLVNSEFHGDFSKKNEAGMAKLLNDQGIIALRSNTDNTISRKWRINLIRLGFISNDTHTVTENGRRLIHSNSLPEEEECFLRALLIQQIPSPLHRFVYADAEKPFNPLRMILEAIDRLGKKGAEPVISKNEMASILILNYDMETIDYVVEKIIEYRKERSASKGAVKRFDASFREQAAQNNQTGANADSLRDYADVNMRYLKLTGLFAEEGVSQLSFATHKMTVIRQILSKAFVPVSDQDYQTTLAKGAILPTDNENEAIHAITNLYQLLIDNGEEVQALPDLYSMEVQDLSLLRINLENQWIHVLEKRYAAEQQYQWEDILIYLKALQQSNSSRRNNHLIPSGEGPAYLEWSIWRSFLAINSLKNLPWEARKFKVDRSFKPVRHAAGGDADMIFEFDDFVFVAEVTLSASSRQEAMEGEPVRRHVANYVDYYAAQGKMVYGLFIANSIDTNTAETFRIGIWYRQDDSSLSLRIVPITLADFTDIFEALFKSGKFSEGPTYLKGLLVHLLQFSNEPAPSWKRIIQTEIQRNITKLIS